MAKRQSGDQKLDPARVMVDGARALANRYRVDDGRDFRLRDVDPQDTAELDDDDEQVARAALEAGVERLAELQERLYAQDRWALLLVFQAMDAAGKDGAIRHVLSGLDPQGVQVAAFKAPSAEELDHDWLWRCQRHLPERGRIGIFNRSYYEEVLVVRVHPELLDRQRLPVARRSKKIWAERFEDIRNYESYLDRNGVVVRKIFLHVSKAEQKRRFLDRIDDPEKNWKFSPRDVSERAHWKPYQSAYEDAIRETSTERAPWFVVPADRKWFARLVVAGAVIDALSTLDLAHPEPDDATKAELVAARRTLAAERG